MGSFAWYDPRELHLCVHVDVVDVSRRNGLRQHLVRTLIREASTNDSGIRAYANADSASRSSFPRLLPRIARHRAPDSSNNAPTFLRAHSRSVSYLCACHAARRHRVWVQFSSGGNPDSSIERPRYPVSRIGRRRLRGEHVRCHPRCCRDWIFSDPLARKLPHSGSVCSAKRLLAVALLLRSSPRGKALLSMNAAMAAF